MEEMKERIGENSDDLPSRSILEEEEFDEGVWSDWYSSFTGRAGTKVAESGRDQRPSGAAS